MIYIYYFLNAAHTREYLMVMYTWFKEIKQVECKFSATPNTRYNKYGFLSDKVMAVRVREGEPKKDHASAHFLQSSCVCQCHSVAHRGCMSEYKYPSSLKVSPNLNGHLQTATDMYSYSGEHIQSLHRAATFPTFSPLAPAFTNINQTTNSSSKASDTVNSHQLVS